VAPVRRVTAYPWQSTTLLHSPGNRNMANSHENREHRAEVFWRAGLSHEAGELIFESLPPERRPKWASSVLKVVVDRCGINSPPIQTVLDIAEQPTKWVEARRVFQMLRDIGFTFDERKDLTREEELLNRVLCLAEIVCRVLYNATSPPNPFDANSGWWVAVCLKRVLDYLDDPVFSESAWRTLCSQGD
jgi:hypothetical protein